MTTQISEAAVSRREANRDRSGRFGNDPAAEADLELADLEVPEDEFEEPEPEEDGGFDHSRISSLMGDAYHLGPERKVALPRINEDDTIAQVHHKLNRYLANTQDVSDIDDEQIAQMSGYELDPDTEMSDELRGSFGISDGDRVVVGRNSQGHRQSS